MLTTKVKYLRYAHEEGHTCVCYTQDGKHIFSCGIDCEIRVWSPDNEDVLSSFMIRDEGTSILFKNNRVFTSYGNSIQSFEYPNWRDERKLLRFSAPVTNVDISKNGKFIAAGSCDMKIKWMNIEEEKIIEFTGHTAPVLQVAMDPSITYLASSSGDGSVKVWDISKGESVFTIQNVIEKSNDFCTAKCLGGPAWYVQGELFLAVPNGTKISMYSSKNWSLDFELMFEPLTKPITLISISSCEEYLCAASVIGELIFWNLKTRNVADYIEAACSNKVAISSLKWHPTEREIVFCDRKGRLCIVAPKLDESFSCQNNEGELNECTDAENVNDVRSEDDNAISLGEIIASSGLYTTENGEVSGGEESENEESEYDMPRKEVVKAYFQPCFQPSATPSHFQNGYMVWNSVGIVRNFNGEESGIEVEFHDTMFHHSFHRRNQHEYCFADLNRHVLCLASTRKVTGIHLNSWAEEKEWSIDMPENESILALAAAENWVCCATELNQLRFYSVAGVQRNIVSLSGPVVCMSGFERSLIVVIHIGMGIPDCQNLGYMIFEISDMVIRAVTVCQPLPISPKTSLKWLGFTDEGTPCTYDSAGILRLSRDFLHWQVMCDTRVHCKNQSDNYFVVGISERLQTARCILCKGSWYPMTIPAPAVVEIPLKIPLCNPEDETTLQEDLFWRHVFSFPVLKRLSLESDDYRSDYSGWERIMKQTLMKLFRNSFCSNAEMRAVELASLMTEQTLEMAFKIVRGGGRSRFTEKLEKINAKDWENLSSGRIDSGLPYYLTKMLPNEPDYKNEIKNNYSHHLSQGDMFADSQQSYLGNGSLHTPANIREDNALESKGSPEGVNDSLTTLKTPVNPFKAEKKANQGPKGLDLFNTMAQSKLKTTKSTPVQQEKMIKPKKSKSDAASKKLNFIQWFTRNKSSLQMQHSDLSDSELTRVAMKIFKEHSLSERNQKQKENDMEVDDVEPSHEAKKRKTDNEQTKYNTSVAEKLNAFSFMK